MLRLLLSTALATLLACAPAFASDADLSAVAQGGTGAFIAGSASSPTDLRSGVAGEWDTAAGRFDWLWKLDAAPGTLDTLTDIVPAGPFVFAIGSANGALSVAKLDAATGTLQRPCGFTGIALHQFGAALVPGRAVESGGRIFLAGATLGNPSRGVIAAIDESTCQVVGSRLVGGGQATGFSAVDAAPDGSVVVSGFSGTSAALFRFDDQLHPLGQQTYGAGDSAFTDVKAAGSQAVAVRSSGLQCVALPSLAATCGTHALGLTGAVLARRPSGGWLVAGSRYGKATGLQPALAPYSAALAPDVQADFRAFGSLPAAFTDLAASPAGIVGAGVSGYFGTRTPFLYTAAPDGSAAAFTPLGGFDAAAAAPRQRLTGLPPAIGAPPRAALKPSRAARLNALRTRPEGDGTFGRLALRCPSACSMRGSVLARSTTVGRVAATLPARHARTLRLRLTPAGRRMLTRHRRVRVTVRVAVTGATLAPQVFKQHLTLTGER
ncbi:hypothetical protein [Candidatus Solirubrobacter pratensis]|uniref:hypothetical protein n=1 Tax=Candidatus Solirubrobacter pratensis TaxID=1298857 RepID=UPI00041DFB5D|nr:hypothetical protein [Candidatus Solirubrobacter pratensis]